MSCAWPVRVEGPTDDADGPPWVAADESGWTGGAVLHQRVMTHATVRVDDRLAGPLLRELRDSTGLRQSREVKFWQFERDKPLAALVDLLGEGGPLHGRTSILVADKLFLALSKIAGLLLGEDDVAIDPLARDGADLLGPQWTQLVTALTGFARGTRRSGRTVDLPSLFDLLESARETCEGHPAAEVLARLAAARNRAEHLLATEPPSLDPLPDMLTAHVERRRSELGEFRLLHDRHKMLDVLAARQRVHTFAVGASDEHPSIQLADLVSGAGRVVFEARRGLPGKQAAALREAVEPFLVELRSRAPSTSDGARSS
ncbi:hypothetical protein [Allokutzneria albata]|uniref:DUF3800 domain-containing protein n=1 Tax=Allokutzneria albata TaxID=211114 RepID=A0A1G9W2R2_ALLAB|nr:hypothetical protein [Allokutzneria albata]SDM78780.1 hypothetical protein SAMN04489726_3366 [Allokutzneria albata]